MRFWKNSILWPLLLPIPVAFIAVAYITMSLPQKLQDNIVNQSVGEAEKLISQLVTFRSFYAKNIVPKFMWIDGKYASTEHFDDPNAIPFPATMIHDVNSAARDIAGYDLLVYSPFPFPNREERVLDAFEQDAWNFLKDNPDQTFSQLLEEDGSTVIRAARASVMSSESCVNCHNTLSYSPIADWQIGDVRGVIEVTQEVTEEFAAATRSVNESLVIVAAIIGVMGMLVAITAARTVGPLRKLTDLLEKREATTEQSAVPFLSRNDEVGKFARAACEVIKARRDIEEIMGKVRDFSSVIGGSSSDLHNASQVLSSRTENQKLSLERANVTLGEIAENARSNVDSAEKAYTVSNEALALARKTRHVVVAAKSAMEHVDESAEKIETVIGVIDSIAFQTNLLALNAAVEAARAGSAGKGFAVVAQEVRALCHRSSKAAEDIKDMIKESHNHVATGRGLVQQTGVTMEELVASLKTTTVFAEDISNRAARQAPIIDTLDTTVSDMQEFASHSAKVADQSAKSARALASEVAILNRFVEQFDQTVGSKVVEGEVLAPVSRQASGAEIGTNNAQNRLPKSGGSEAA